MPFFSIITVSFNSEKTIERTFKSLLYQTCRDFEYIVIDGSSTDGTVGIVKKYEHIFREKKICLKWVSEPDDGIYDAMNKGIRMSSGRLIGIVNSDDYYTSNALEEVRKSAEKNIDVGIFHGILRQFNENNDTVCYVAYSDLLLPRQMIMHPTCFIRREVYEKRGMYDTTFKFAADYDFILRMKENGIKFLLLETVISNFSLEGVSQNSKDAFEDGLRVRKKHNVEKAFSILLARIKLFYDRKIR